MFKFVPFHCAHIADPHSTGLNMRHHGTAGVVIRLTPHLALVRPVKQAEFELTGDKNTSVRPTQCGL